MAIRNTTVISETAIEIQRRFQPDWFGVEVNQFQQLLADNIRQLANERRVLVPLYTLDNRVNKLVRIRRLTPLLSQGRIRFKGDSPGARLLVEQLRDFPNGDHDDGPDALEMAVRLAAELLSRTDDEVETILVAV
jgi:predicted phage terminase large subunit-like protein